MKYLLLLLIGLFVVSCTSAPEEKAAKEDVKKEEKKEESKPAEPKVEEVKDKAPQEPAVAGAITCSSSNDVRTIVNQKSDTGGCEVVYTKFGESKVIATAQKDIEYCNGVVDRVRKNLEAANFICK